jgi:hypothetical protein
MLTLFGKPREAWTDQQWEEGLRKYMASPYLAGLDLPLMPGGIINYPPRAAECNGCGAPLRAHICDYCKRTTQ